jgi:DNA-binding NarL/FixJ family response regulator
MVLQLLGQGFQQRQIAAMLEVSEATMSRMLPKGLSKNAGKARPQLVKSEEE